MNFVNLLIGVVILAVLAPEQTAALGTRLVRGLFPIIEQGLVLAIMAAGIMIILGRFK